MSDIKIICDKKIYKTVKREYVICSECVFNIDDVCSMPDDIDITCTHDEIWAKDEDLVIMPKELTAENGAKALLMGEFFEEVEHDCLRCDYLDEDDDCDFCDGSGMYYESTAISWTTIKEIYKMAVKHLKEGE